MNLYYVTVFNPKGGKVGEGEQAWPVIVAPTFDAALMQVRRMYPHWEITNFKLQQSGLIVI